MYSRYSVERLSVFFFSKNVTNTLTYQRSLNEVSKMMKKVQDKTKKLLSTKHTEKGSFLFLSTQTDPKTLEYCTKSYRLQFTKPAV